ncbi:MAG: hypothetical protein IPK12_20460 [Gemmatimonadetes bacterium]|nr:hypothetical protein [Gemmatimonadota bacterium]
MPDLLDIHRLQASLQSLLRPDDVQVSRAGRMSFALERVFWGLRSRSATWNGKYSLESISYNLGEPKYLCGGGASSAT